jgi:hypothetical protein
MNDTAPARHGLGRAPWEQVLTAARARLMRSARDLALIQTLGAAGPRSHEARALPADPFDRDRSDSQGGSVSHRAHIISTKGTQV